MNLNLKKNCLLPWLEKRATLLLACLTIFSSVLWIIITFWKYQLFLYDAMDLAIYSQVFWNTSYGRWFQMSIHPQSYLGDHFEPFILLLTPIYALWRDPRMILVLQTLAIQLSVIPLYLLARNIFKKNESIKYPYALSLLIAVSYLLNPFVHNALIFEFHILPFFLLPFFWALYFAERGQLGKFLIFIFLAITVREDIPIVAALAGVIAVSLFPAARQRRRWMWIILPLVLSALWFALSLNIISHFSPTGEFKFAVYYASLQGTWWQTLQYIVGNPWPLFARVFQFANMETLIGLFLPFAFLGLIAPVSLGLGLLPFLQFAFLDADSRGVLILHYGVLFLPALFLSAIFALNKLAVIRSQKISVVLGWPTSWPLHFGVLFFISASIYGAFTLGQTKDLIAASLRQAQDAKLSSINFAYDYVKGFRVIIADKGLLPNLSSRQHIYSLKYILDGKQQFSELPYFVPEPIGALILDQASLLRVSIILENGQLQFVPYNKRVENLRALIKNKGLEPVWNKDGIAVFRDDSDSAEIMPLITHKEGIIEDGNDMGEGIKVQGEVVPLDSESILLETRWAISQQLTENYFLDLQIQDASGRTLKNYILDPGWGIEPTSLWSPNTITISRFVLSVPKRAKIISFSLFPVNGMIEKYGGLRENLPHMSTTVNKSIIIKIEL